MWPYQIWSTLYRRKQCPQSVLLINCVFLYVVIPKIRIMSNSSNNYRNMWGRYAYMYANILRVVLDHLRRLNYWDHRKVTSSLRVVNTVEKCLESLNVRGSVLNTHCKMLFLYVVSHPSAVQHVPKWAELRSTVSAQE